MGALIWIPANGWGEIMAYKLRNMEPNDLETVFSKMKDDFPANERAPFRFIRKNIEKKIFEGFLLTDGHKDLAYSINISSTDGDYQLINYLAVLSGCRGQGIGTALLWELKKLYSGKKAIIVEVEPPDDDMKKSRVRFYERAGFVMLENVEYTLFGVKMCVMFWSDHLSAADMRESIADIIQNIYRRTVPKLLWGRIKIN